MSNELDLERPPAGTECVSCRAGGHFCPATLYVQNTDLGICQPCKDGTDCPRFKVVRAEPVLFEPEEEASTMSPARVVPPEEWPEDTSIHEQNHDIDDVPFGLKNVVREERKTNPQSPLQGTPKAAWKFVPRPPGNRIPDEIRKAIAEEPLEIRDFEIAQKYGCSSASVLNIRREAGLEIPVREKGPRKSGSGRDPGATYKTEKREIAKSLLLEGQSVRKAAAIAGICTNTVRLAKAEIPVESLPPAQTGGFHAQDKQREYLAREKSRLVPQPEEVLQLAADLVEARNRLADLEERWEAFFSIRIGQR